MALGNIRTVFCFFIYVIWQIFRKTTCPGINLWAPLMSKLSVLDCDLLHLFWSVMVNVIPLGFEFLSTIAIACDTTSYEQKRILCPGTDWYSSFNSSKDIAVQAVVQCLDRRGLQGKWNFRPPKYFFQINLILQVAFFKDIESPKKETGHPQRGRAKVNSCSPNRATSILLKRTTETEKKQQGEGPGCICCRYVSAWAGPHISHRQHTNAWRITWQLPGRFHNDSTLSSRIYIQHQQTTRLTED